MRDTRISYRPGATASRYVPSLRVITPVMDPMTRTWASGMGAPDEASVTRPATVPVLCAAAEADSATRTARDVAARRRAARKWVFVETTCADMRPASEWRECAGAGLNVQRAVVARRFQTDAAVKQGCRGRQYGGRAFALNDTVTHVAEGQGTMPAYANAYITMSSR